jgi:hypothetical protein
VINHSDVGSDWCSAVDWAGAWYVVHSSSSFSFPSRSLPLTSHTAPFLSRIQLTNTPSLQRILHPRNRHHPLRLMRERRLRRFQPRDHDQGRLLRQHGRSSAVDFDYTICESPSSLPLPSQSIVPCVSKISYLILTFPPQVANKLGATPEVGLPQDV